MAHFAELDENNNVIGVHVVNNDVITIDGIESEEVGIQFLASLHGHSLWKQTSYSNSFRKRYAGIGMIYDEIRDAFYHKKEHDSWIFDEDEVKWVPPTPYPSDNKYYKWNEETVSWIEIPL